MQKRLAKEFHFLLLPILATLLLPFGVGVLFQPSDESVVLLSMALGCALIGASVFGREFSHGTMAQLLAQPVSRLRLWGEKMLALVIAMSPWLVVSLWLWLVSVERGVAKKELGLMVLFVPWCAICTTPYLTLLTRNTMGAVVFSFAIPMLFLLMCSAVGQHLEKIGFWDRFNNQTVRGYQVQEGISVLFIFSVLFIYCATFCWLGYRKFKNFQVIEQQPADMHLGSVVEILVRRVSSVLLRNRRSASWSLVAKEFRLQHMTFMLTAVLWALQLAALLYIKFAHPPGGEIYWLVPFVLHVALIPVVVGGLSVAEERNLGTHGWHLTLPVSARRQWFIKLAVCLPLSFLLGVALPYGWMLGVHAVASEIPGAGSFEFGPALLICAAQIFVTAAAIYGSSLSNNTLRAIVLGIITAVICCSTVGVIERVTGFLGIILDISGNEPTTNQLQHWISIATLGAFCFATIVATISILACAFGNFRRVDVQLRRVWHHALIVFSPVLVIGWLATLALSILLRLQ